MRGFKSQIPNPKSQTNSKLQIPTAQTTSFGVFNLGHWSLFVIWCLGFGAYDLLSNAHQGEDSSKSEEQGRRPGGEQGREDTRFSKGEKNIKGHPVGKTDHDADPDAQCHPS